MRRSLRHSFRSSAYPQPGARRSPLPFGRKSSLHPVLQAQWHSRRTHICPEARWHLPPPPVQKGHPFSLQRVWLPNRSARSAPAHPGIPARIPLPRGRHFLTALHGAVCNLNTGLSLVPGPPQRSLSWWIQRQFQPVIPDQMKVSNFC